MKINKINSSILTFLFFLSMFINATCKKEKKEEIKIPRLKKVFIIKIVGSKFKLKRKGSLISNLVIKQQLFANDIILVGSNSFLELQIGDIGIIRIDANTKLKLLNLFKGNNVSKTVLGLKEGTLYANINNVNTHNLLSIRTPLGLCRAYGIYQKNLFAISHKKKVSTISLLSGEVNIKKNLTKEQIHLEKSKTAILKKDKSKIQLKLFKQKEKLMLEKISSLNLLSN